RGDPTAALLEVLDPAQNASFVDHYLEVPFDLSGVMFIATANSLAPIPDPLLDRMEVLTLPGYTPGEKLAIAKRFLLPRQFKETGLTPERASLADAALERLIAEYTREAGVRQLEREIQGVLRKAALEVVEGRAGAVRISIKNLEKYAGQPKVQSEVAGRSPEVGVATGLASLLCQRPARHDVAMTGELTLRGRVLPIGGLKEKLTAAARAGVKTVIVPARNQSDIVEVPDEVKKLIEIKPVDTLDEVLELALLEPRVTRSVDVRPRKPGSLEVRP